jgi:hypothetical protein
LYITFKIIVTLILKKKECKKRVIGYMNGNIKAVLDSVKFILPIMDNEWNFVLKHYNKTYNL